MGNEDEFIVVHDGVRLRNDVYHGVDGLTLTGEEYYKYTHGRQNRLDCCLEGLREAGLVIDVITYTGEIEGYMIFEYADNRYRIFYNREYLKLFINGKPVTESGKHDVEDFIKKVIRITGISPHTI